MKRTDKQRITASEEAAAPPSTRPRKVQFERHVGTGYPLRAVHPDGSWHAVNRNHEGLYFCDAGGRIVELIGREGFRAVSPRQFEKAFMQVYGQTLASVVHSDPKR